MAVLEQQAVCPWVPAAAVLLPPARNGARGEGRRIVRDADGHAPAVGGEIVNAMGIATPIASERKS